MPDRSVYTNAALKGSKVPYPHRFFLSDGRVLEARMFREPHSRLEDDLYGTKGDFVSLTDVRCTTTGGVAPYMAVNQQHIVSIEEM